uniref:Variant surface glycoprotein 1125.4182 n=1 Tax=Trypanosoma brucei TaxID=5691 RepID=A0A1J0RA06_9TRYP|nr:variant surface glycoprotein 1125.4182 [Trypanosoma brucei]
MAMKSLINLPLVLVILKSQVPGALAAAGDNEQLFLDLCHVLALAKRPIPEISGVSEAGGFYKQIQKYNSSFSSLEWRKQFSQTGENKKRPAYKPENGKEDEVRKQRWQHWTGAEEELEEEQPKGKTLKEAGADVPDTRTRLLWLAQLQPIAERADAVMQTIEHKYQGASEFSKDKIRKLMTDAAYGPSAATLTEIQQANIVADNGGATTRSALCGADAAGAKAATVAAYLFCLCASHGTDNGGGDKVSVTNHATHNEGNSANLNGAQAEIKDLAGKCYTDAATAPLTAEEIRLAVATFASKLHPKQGKAYYGKYTATGCSGSGAQGICVMYKTDTAGNAAAAKNIPWVQNLLNVADKLEKQQAASQTLEALTAELKALKSEAYNIGQQVKLSQEIHKLTAPTEDEKLKGQKKQEQQAKLQYETINKATECRQKQPTCEWKGKNDDDGEHCQLNATHVAQQQTAKTRKEETTTDKCSQAKNPEKCAAVKRDIPKDKKAAWMD